MGKRWQDFQDKVSDFIAGPAQVEPAPQQPETPPQPMRAYRQEELSDYQRKDLMEIVNLPGYEVLLDLHESTLEGFITYLVETPPEGNDKRILDLHKLVHAGYLFNRSVQKQVEAYKRIEEAEEQEAKEIKAALAARSGDPLEDTNTLNKVLNPIYVPEPQPPKAKFVRRVPETPLDAMLKASQ